MTAGQFSADRAYWWDGAEWRQVSPDKAYFWSGNAWVAIPVKASASTSSATTGAVSSLSLWSILFGILLLPITGLIYISRRGWSAKVRWGVAGAWVLAWMVVLASMGSAASAPPSKVVSSSSSSSSSTRGPLYEATLPTHRPSPSVMASPTLDPDAAVGATAPPTTTSFPPISGQVCGDPTAHVYSPDRLKLLAACVTVTGTVAVIRVEADGDLHLLLKLDAGQEKYLNAKNISAELGDLVLEPVCVRTPTQTDAISACAGYQNPLAIPAVGTHVAVTGPWVLDQDHGWQEIHPVFAFNGVGAPPTTAPTAAPTPVPTVAPTAAPPPAPQPPPVTNLCGAPSNPWNYNFCGGNLITSPASGFCGYFSCISSFATGTGYVVQCGDGKFSKSGGHTGVCSQHGGFLKNLYSP